MDAFISYRRATGEIYAEEIFQNLKNLDFDVFFDRDQFYGHAGAFTPELQAGIQAADNFILVLSDLAVGDYEKSVFVQEILHALELDKRIIIVKTAGFIFPEDLPEKLSVLPDLQALEISDMQYFRNQFILDLVSKMKRSTAVQNALNKLTANTKLESRRIVENTHSLAERLGGDVDYLDVCAFSCRNLLFRARDYLEELLKKGCHIRILISKQGSAAAIDSYTKKSTGGSLKQRERVITQSYEDLLDWQDEYPEYFEGKTTEEFLPCAIMIVRRKNTIQSTIKVDYYSFNCPDDQRRCVLIPARDTENYNFYKDQFEWLWDKGEPVKNKDDETQ